MKALEITAPHSARIVERPEPAVGPGQLLLRVERVGFCGTDLASYRGHNPLVSYPRVPGHEIGATIESIGPEVEGPYRIGQNVLVMPYQNCGQCAACRAGRPNCCQNNQTLGVQREGAMTELVVVPAEKVIASDRLSMAELALVEPLSIGFHATDRGRVAAGETVAVFGCGAIGLGVVAACAERGASVIGIDVDAAKLDLARACGATHTINSRATSLHERLLEVTEGLGPRIVFEAVGAAETFRAAVDEACHAGRVVYIGYAKAPVEYDTRQFVLKELDMLGSRNALPEDFAAAAAMLERGRFPTDRVITHLVDFDEAADALAAWSNDPANITKIQVRIR